MVDEEAYLELRENVIKSMVASGLSHCPPTIATLVEIFKPGNNGKG